MFRVEGRGFREFMVQGLRRSGLLRFRVKRAQGVYSIPGPYNIFPCTAPYYDFLI